MFTITNVGRAVGFARDAGRGSELWPANRLYGTKGSTGSIGIYGFEQARKTSNYSWLIDYSQKPQIKV